MEIVDKIIEKGGNLQERYHEKKREIEEQYQEKRKELESQYRQKKDGLESLYEEKKKYFESRYRRQFRIIRNFITWPFICGMIVPIVIFDFFLEIYHHICFQLYGLPLIKRKHYIRIDRHKLQYLSFLDKIFCAYCGYANGLMHYATIIAGETEKYWCAIKHKKGDGFKEPAHHKDFPEYGDEEGHKKYSEKYFG